MTRFTKSLLATVLLTGPMLAGGVVAAHAQMPMQAGPTAASFDPAQLPEFKGKVAQYTLSPHGDVDGLILADGTEVQLPPHLSTALVFSVKPGDAVSIRGLKARAVNMVSAVTITNDASGAVVGGGETGRGPSDGTRMEATGKIKELLHTPRGDVGGALLEDGTVLRLPPPEAAKQATLFAVGQTISVKGFGISGPLGKAIGVMEMGPSADKLTKVAMPHMRGMHGHEGMMGMMGMMHGKDAMKP